MVALPMAVVSIVLLSLIKIIVPNIEDGAFWAIGAMLALFTFAAALVDTHQLDTHNH